MRMHIHACTIHAHMHTRHSHINGLRVCHRVCMHMCTYACVDACTCAFTCTFKCAYACMYARTFACTCTFKCTYACTYPCACVCTCTFECTNGVNQVWPRGLRINEKSLNCMRHVQKKSEQSGPRGLCISTLQKCDPYIYEITTIFEGCPLQNNSFQKKVQK